MAHALTQFAAALSTENPSAAMRLACAALRQRVREAGRAPGLDAYIQAFGLRVEEAPIPTAGRLDQEGGQYIVRVQRTGYRGDVAATSGQPRDSLTAPPSPLRVSDATNRQRLTIAHEIGHALLLERLKDQPESLAALRDPAAWAEIEALCDEAAGDLLVPLEELAALAGQLGVSLRGLERLADRFRVAQEVLEARLLAAGALSLSLWRVSASPGNDQDGRWQTRFERILASAGSVHGWPVGSFPTLETSTFLIPDIVLEAARAGRASYALLEVNSGEDAWTLGAVAACQQPLGTHAAQPSLLDPPSTDPSGAASAADTLVTLLLFPLQAVEAGAPLWVALTAR